MKVVLFCGGQGMRMREFSEVIPKPMVQLGYRPIVWHLMRYYAHYGHTEFILCLGYRGDVIKQYFLNYNECVSNDFVLTGGGKDVRLLGKDIHNWQITFIDTGLNSNIGQRLMRVRKFLGDDEVFLANYADGLTDLPLDMLLEYAQRQNRVACFLGVRPLGSYHLISIGKDGGVTDVQSLSHASSYINGGFFVLRKDIFNFINDGEELVEQPFRRLLAKGQLAAYPYDGFFACMDTFKEKQHLDELYARGDAPWEVWRTHASSNRKG